MSTLFHQTKLWLLGTRKEGLGVIDFHTHLLPGIDDGSQDAATTEAMLREEARQGISRVIATPHFYAGRSSVEHFLRRRAEAAEAAERAGKRLGEPVPRLTLGAEVYYFRDIGGARAVESLCVVGTRTLLLELPFEQWDRDVLRDVRQLAEKRGFRLVLAHVERYIEFQRKMDIWNRIMELPLVPQINAGSFLRRDSLLRRDKRRRFCIEFLRERPDTIIGSDCHNMTGRRPNLAEGRAAIVAELGEVALERIDRAARTALEEDVTR